METRGRCAVRMDVAMSAADRSRVCNLGTDMVLYPAASVWGFGATPIAHAIKAERPYGSPGARSG